jgi:hypothetical protein
MRCSYMTLSDDSTVIQCTSENARWVDTYQGYLCFIHERAHKRSLAKADAMRRHPSNRGGNKQ